MGNQQKVECPAVTVATANLMSSPLSMPHDAAAQGYTCSDPSDLHLAICHSPTAGSWSVLAMDLTALRQRTRDELAKKPYSLLINSISVKAMKITLG